ncbi:MAG: hypothetical protein Q8S84_05885 [bacterium]|nr:hypothetical protein [bacterium]MDP3381010.1 hypothetical protein [bacterium]
MFFVNHIENHIHTLHWIIAVFIHITFQSKFIRGHPLFPGFIAASVCISHEIILLPSLIFLFFQLITPRDTEFWNSDKAFHIAIANCHTFISSILFTKSRVLNSFLSSMISKIAKSLFGSVAITFASYSILSFVITV